MYLRPHTTKLSDVPAGDALPLEDPPESCIQRGSSVYDFSQSLVIDANEPCSIERPEVWVEAPPPMRPPTELLDFALGDRVVPAERSGELLQPLIDRLPSG